MSTPYLLALDQGTTSSRAIVFDQAGNIRAQAQKEFRQLFPRPGWVEHDAQELWSTQLGVAQEAITGAGLRASDIAAIGITNQRETVVIWERSSGQPIHNAVVWQDRRTAGLCDQLRAQGQEDLIQRKTGLILDAYFSGTKVKWLLDNVPGARERAGRGELAFGTVDSWLVYNLSGGELHITDASNASRTLLYNIHTGDWDDELLALLDVPRSILPQVRASSEVYGETAEGLLGSRIKIAGIAGDQQAATFGQACLERGMAKNTYGTGCFLLMNTAGEAVPSQNRLLTTVAWQFGPERTYALEGSVFVAGAVVQWLRDGLGIIRSSSEVEALAMQRARQRRGVSGARLRGPGRAVLGQLRPRRHPRHDARHHQSPHRPRRPGSGGLSKRRTGRRHAKRQRRDPHRAARRRRSQHQRLVDAVSGRRAGRAGGQTPRHRDHRAGGRVSGGPGGGGVAQQRRNRRPVARRRTL